MPVPPVNVLVLMGVEDDMDAEAVEDVAVNLDVVLVKLLLLVFVENVDATFVFEEGEEEEVREELLALAPALVLVGELSTFHVLGAIDATAAATLNSGLCASSMPVVPSELAAWRAK